MRERSCTAQPGDASRAAQMEGNTLRIILGAKIAQMLPIDNISFLFLLSLSPTGLSLVQCTTLNTGHCSASAGLSPGSHFSPIPVAESRSPQHPLLHHSSLPRTDWDCQHSDVHLSCPFPSPIASTGGFSWLKAPYSHLLLAFPTWPG